MKYTVDLYLYDKLGRERSFESDAFGEYEHAVEHFDSIDLERIYNTEKACRGAIGMRGDYYCKQLVEWDDEEIEGMVELHEEYGGEED